MAYQESLQRISLPAGEDLTGKQFYPVKVDTSGEAVASTAVTAPPVGILQNKPDDGEVADVAIAGVTKAVIGTGDATAGSLATWVANGLTDAGSGEIAYGTWITGGSAGEVGVLLLGPGAGSTAA